MCDIALLFDTSLFDPKIMDIPFETVYDSLNSQFAVP